jgi:integrase
MGTKVGRRVIGKLSARHVQTLKVPGHYGDGGGLWLQISDFGTKSWVFRFTRNAKTREMGLGPYPDVSLLKARENASDYRAAVREGKDPIEQRNAKNRDEASNAARAVTFKDEAAAYIEAHRAGWKNAKHAEQWTATLETYAFPFIGKQLVSEIDAALVMKCLQPIWATKTETASRVRGRIESVLDYATALKHRTGDNPARWRGHLDNLLAKPSKVAKREHHPALPYTQVGAFMADLRAQDGISARALEFTILTGTRTGEAIGARWEEIDLANALWVVPADRMKAGKPHRVPLSKAAVAVLKKLQGVDAVNVFPGSKADKPLSNMAMLVLLQKRMNRPDLTVHGFRSTFRDWAAEQSNFPNEVVEMALAHTIEDQTEAAYRRGDLVEKRTKLMEAWAGYCGRVLTDATVTPIHVKKA